MSTDHRLSLWAVCVCLTLVAVAKGEPLVHSVVTLRSSDNVCHPVMTAAIVEHSAILRALVNELVGDDDVAVIDLYDISSREIQLIVDFVSNVALHEISEAKQWVKDTLSTGDCLDECLLLEAAHSLDVSLLVQIIASRQHDLGQLSAMRPLLSMDVFRLVLGPSHGLCRLGELVRNRRQEAIVDHLRGLVVSGSVSAVFVNNVQWDPTYGNVLHWAVRHNEEHVVELLVNIPGVDVDARRKRSRTPLHWAAAAGNADVVWLLLNAPGIDVNARDEHDCTPLSLAAMAGHHAAVVVLLKAPKIDVNACNKDQLSPLYWAAYFGHNQTVMSLVNAPGIDVNTRGYAKQTPLHVAVSQGHRVIVELLLRAPGIDIHAQEAYGHTALDLARLRESSNLVQLLESRWGWEFVRTIKKRWTRS
ncbi:Ankyrin repeat domain-containing protein [Plasmodiophora brassicae]|uniref:Uncharacterized protein n=1 Tax=Plasmodiophora brassicae TaxID=37360 RepID=A0A0G4J178_PLABS|nr:hypothetical protein PBRA_001921 [Plasmodiophora brassicae]